MIRLVFFLPLEVTAKTSWELFGDMMCVYEHPSPLVDLCQLNNLEKQGKAV